MGYYTAYLQLPTRFQTRIFVRAQQDLKVWMLFLLKTNGAFIEFQAPDLLF